MRYGVALLFCGVLFAQQSQPPSPSPAKITQVEQSKAPFKKGAVADNNSPAKAAPAPPDDKTDATITNGKKGAHAETDNLASLGNTLIAHQGTVTVTVTVTVGCAGTVDVADAGTELPHGVVTGVVGVQAAATAVT
jgi:hypothetical protein